MIPRHHVIISGTGRAGTTFLVELLTRLGADTGYTLDTLKIDPISRAGLEWDIRKANAPYIVKSPWLCTMLPEILASGKIVIDRAIIPVRGFDEAAASRAKVSDQAREGEKVYGGLWLTDDPTKQAAVLRELLGNLITTLVRHDVPITFLDFPRLTRDPLYLYDRFAGFADNDFKLFRKAFNETARPEMIPA